MARFGIIFLALLGVLLNQTAFGKDNVIQQERFTVKTEYSSLSVRKYYGAQSARHILLVHGLTYSSHVFDVSFKDYSLAKSLVDAGYSVWTMDVSGYGLSELKDSSVIVNSKTACNDICIIIDHILLSQGLKNLDLLGWSWGTITASCAAQKKKDHIENLILYAPIFKGLEGDIPIENWHKNDWSHATDDFPKKSDKNINYNRTERAVLGIFVSNCWKYDQDLSPNGGRQELLQKSDSMFIDLNGLDMNILLIAGDEDPYVDRKLFEQWCKHSEKISCIWFKNASHILMLEKSHYKRFQKVILDFLI